MHPIAYLLDTILSVYNFALIAWVILGWLIALRIVNGNNDIVYRIYAALTRMVSPALSFIRRYIPSIAGLDLAPIALLIAVGFFRYALRYYF
ncbi:YggT family protein [Anaplasma platys]|uniref:YggT family protein n=1 Tax=Anaplasma platys TaxID=949 RepID=A0A858PYV8_9RICK|nr:YggT family protein [Anaplasma platys]QJC27750.1 YggT family protein [Anaplasma platys]